MFQMWWGMLLIKCANLLELLTELSTSVSFQTAPMRWSLRFDAIFAFILWTFELFKSYISTKFSIVLICASDHWESCKVIEWLCKDCHTGRYFTQDRPSSANQRPDKTLSSTVSSTKYYSLTLQISIHPVSLISIHPVLLISPSKLVTTNSSIMLWQSIPMAIYVIK